MTQFRVFELNLEVVEKRALNIYPVGKTIVEVKDLNTHSSRSPESKLFVHEALFKLIKTVFVITKIVKKDFKPLILCGKEGFRKWELSRQAQSTLSVEIEGIKALFHCLFTVVFLV